MTQTQTQLEFGKFLRSGYLSFARLDLDEIENGLAPEIQWHTPGRHPLSGTCNGIEEVKDWIRASAEMTNGTFRVDLIRIVGDRLHAAVIATYRGERKGMTLEMPGVQTFRLDPKRNLVVEARIFVYDDEFVNRFWSA
ncbi:MAG TPA: nuclear transport factor 2 family protein [Candidatus Limnocylindrales bacterium]|nr:nuclear transport factor 2 family protein [Candidatus Limnocylindrales bacterium]